MHRIPGVVRADEKEHGGTRDTPWGARFLKRWGSDNRGYPGLLSLLPFAQGGGGWGEGPFGPWGYHMMWGAWGIGWMLFMVLFWAAVIVGVVLGIRWLVGYSKEARSDSALEILRQRYARGEINKEEFEAKKRDLA